MTLSRSSSPPDILFENSVLNVTKSMFFVFINFVSFLPNLKKKIFILKNYQHFSERIIKLIFGFYANYLKNFYRIFKQKLTLFFSTDF